MEFRLLGIQFDVLFSENLYLDLANHANLQAMKIKKVFENEGFRFLSDTFTNQIFPILSQNQITQISEKFDFYIWKIIDSEHAAIRLITSWATSDSIVDEFCDIIRKLKS